MSAEERYQEATNNYTAQLRRLFLPAGIPGVKGPVLASAPSSDELAERAEQLYLVSRRLSQLIAVQLVSDDPGQREVAEQRLLAHTTADFEAGRGLLATMDLGTPKDALLPADGSEPAADFEKTLAEMATILERPFEIGIGGPITKDPVGGSPMSGVNPFGHAAPPVGGGTNPFSPGAPPVGGSTNPFGHAAPPVGGGTNPFSPGAPPVGGSTNPFGHAAPPVGGGSNPFSPGAPPVGGSTNPFGHAAPFVGAQLLPPTDPAVARVQLQSSVERALASIINNACTTGGQAVRFLLLGPGAAGYVLLRMTNEDAATWLDEAAANLGGATLRLALAAGQLLLHAYQWLVSLLGAATQQQVITQAATWLQYLEKYADNITGVLPDLVARLYAPDLIRQEVVRLLATTNAGLDPLVGAITDVDALAARYQAKTATVTKLLGSLTATRVMSISIPLLATPQFQMLATAFTLGLFGYVVYTGYEHLDSGRLKFRNVFGFDIPHHVEGVHATVRKVLAPETTSAPSPS